MKILRYSLTAAAYVLLIGAFFFFGYMWGKNNTKAVLNAETDVPAQAAAVKNDIENAPQYLLIIENGQICIYKEENNTRELIQSSHITEGIFPSVDIKQLRDGIRLDSYEEAQQLFENFVS